MFNIRMVVHPDLNCADLDVTWGLYDKVQSVSSGWQELIWINNIVFLQEKMKITTYKETIS